MTTETSTKKLGARLITSIGSLIVVPLILLVYVNYFIKGGIPQVSQIIKISTAMAPIITPIAIISILRMRVHDVLVRAPKWQYGLGLIGSFVATYLLGKIVGTTATDYTQWYAIWGGAGSIILVTVELLNTSGAFIRVMRVRSGVTFALVFTIILSFMVVTPIMSSWLPFMLPFGNWIQRYVQLAVDNAHWMQQYLIFALGMTMIMLFKEKLSPETAR